MGGKQASAVDGPPNFVKAWRKFRNLTQDELAEKVKIDRSAISKIEKGDNPLMEARLPAFARALEIQVPQLFESPPRDIHKGQNILDSRAGRGVPLTRGLKRAQDGNGGFESTESVSVIGSVQAGAWREINELPSTEWVEMHLLKDRRYPGVERFALKNIGESMNRRCANGGYWTFVRLHDLAGIGPRPGDYVIVHRIKKDGNTEATCKKMELRDGKAWLVPDSTDPSYEAFPAEPDDPEIAEVRVIGLCTGVHYDL